MLPFRQNIFANKFKYLIIDIMQNESLHIKLGHGLELIL